MSRMSHLSGLLLTVLLLGVVRAEAQSVGNALGDAGFEEGLAGEAGGWTFFDGSGLSTDHALSGRQSVYNWGFSRTVPAPPFLTGRASGSYQEFPATPGSRWRLTGYGMTPAQIKGYPAFGILQVSFFDAEGNDLGTVETEGNVTARAKVSNEVNSEAPVGEWLSLDTGVATAPAGTTTVQAFTLFVDYSGANIPQGAHFDDLRLCETDADGDCVTEQARLVGAPRPVTDAPR